MKTKIRVTFKDNRECIFDANEFIFQDNGFCDLEFIDDRGSVLVASVCIDEIKYLKFVEEERERITNGGKK